MPIPSVPPPSNEAGALLSPRQLNRWLDVNPIHPLSRTQTYLTFPAFDLEFGWNGYSQIIAAYNFTALQNFTLPAFTAPLLPDYLLCISWIDSDNNMHRYKLWEDVGEILYFDCDLYTGQLIKKNFRFEVWNIEPSSINLDRFTITGAGSAIVNQVYINSHANDEWVGETDPTLSMYKLTPSIPYSWTIFGGGNIYYNSSSTDTLPFTNWTLSTDGVNPLPTGHTSVTATQLTDLIFYTSVRGNYDYMWQDDTILASPSAIITNFNIANNNAPWTAPANSISAVNT